MVLARGGQSKGPTSEEAISEAEKRLGTELPKSLKDFWRASNGLMHIRLDADEGLIFGVETVSWLKSSNPDLIPENIGAPALDEDYFDYGPDQDPIYLRDAYIQSTLVVSDLVDSGIYLLNPEDQLQGTCADRGLVESL
jgi:hypothetical protein